METLDRVTAEIPMNDGILSKDGWYMIDDARGDLLVNDWIEPRDTKIIFRISIASSTAMISRLRLQVSVPSREKFL